MLITSPAIVFKSIKYKESSLILDIYTREKGLRKYIISGVRQAKARTPASLLQLMNLVEIVAYEREDREMHRLKEVRLARPYHQIPFDLKRGTLGLFLLEITRKSVQEREANPALFDYLFDSFCFLDDTEHSIANLHLHFLLGLSQFLGFLPVGDWSPETPLFDLQEGHFIGELPGHKDYLTEEAAQLLYTLLRLERERLHDLPLNRISRQKLLSALVSFYRFHVPGLGEINSLKVLKEIM